MTDFDLRDRILSPRDLSVALGVGRSTVQRWIDKGAIRASRTVGGHRRVQLAEALRFIRTENLAVPEPAALGLDLSGIGNGDSTAPRDAGLASRFAAALDAGKESTCRSLLTAAYLDGALLPDLCDVVIAPAMRSFGDKPIADTEVIYREHRASEICIRAIHELRVLLPPPPDDARVAVGGAFPGDLSTLPTTMVALTFAALGWDAVSLGPNTPLEAIAVAATDHDARLAWLSVGRHDTHDPAALSESIEPLATSLAAEGIRLVIGGRGIPAAWRPSHSNVLNMENLRELTLYVRGLAEGSDHRPA